MPLKNSPVTKDVYKGTARQRALAANPHWSKVAESDTGTKGGPLTVALRAYYGDQVSGDNTSNTSRQKMTRPVLKKRKKDLPPPTMAKSRRLSSITEAVDENIDMGSEHESKQSAQPRKEPKSVREKPKGKSGGDVQVMFSDKSSPWKEFETSMRDQFDSYTPTGTQVDPELLTGQLPGVTYPSESTMDYDESESVQPRTQTKKRTRAKARRKHGKKRVSSNSVEKPKEDDKEEEEEDEEEEEGRGKKDSYRFVDDKAWPTKGASLDYIWQLFRKEQSARLKVSKRKAWSTWSGLSSEDKQDWYTRHMKASMSKTASNDLDADGTEQESEEDEEEEHLGPAPKMFDSPAISGAKSPSPKRSLPRLQTQAFNDDKGDEDDCDSGYQSPLPDEPPTQGALFDEYSNYLTFRTETNKSANRKTSKKANRQLWKDFCEFRRVQKEHEQKDMTDSRPSAERLTFDDGDKSGPQASSTGTRRKQTRTMPLPARVQRKVGSTRDTPPASSLPDHDGRAAPEKEDPGSDADEQPPRGLPPPATPGKRRRFTEEEELALVKGVERHGEGQWRQILKDPEFYVLTTRTNVNLKDKYRNLKAQGLVNSDN